MIHGKQLFVLAMLLGLAAAGCRGVSRTRPATAEGEEKEVAVALDQLPAAVREAALAAVPGLVIEEAAREVARDGSVLYEVEGSAHGKEYEIEVTAGGRVLEVESEDADDEQGGGRDGD